MGNALDTLRERGFVYQVSNEAGLRAAFEGPVSFYIGFDPTAESLHVGNLLGIMTMAQLQRHGHRPIVLVGGGTGMVGDPTGKSDARQILTLEQIERNMAGVRPQFARYLQFEGGANAAIMVNNADWLRPLRYIDFLRDIGRHFSVNQMLAAETYKTRLESGLSFLEFNYMILQAYDFLHLFQAEQCVLQMGGSDQWANCLAGADLIRRVEGREAFVLVTPLLTTASGAKMGKTERGSVWLDPTRTSPYEYYQFWINTEDADVERFLALYTFLPMEQVKALGGLEGAALRQAKEVLAYETTALTHGAAAAAEARQASRAAFGGDGDLAAIPAVTVARRELADGLPILDLLVRAGLAASRSAARRLVEQGGASIDGVVVGSVDERLVRTDGSPVLVRAGRKHVRRVQPV